MAPNKVLMVSVLTPLRNLLLISLSLSLCVSVSDRDNLLCLLIQQVAEKPSIALSVASALSGGRVSPKYLYFTLFSIPNSMKMS